MRDTDVNYIKLKASVQNFIVLRHDRKFNDIWLNKDLWPGRTVNLTFRSRASLFLVQVRD